MKLTGKRVAVLVENLYQEMELWYPVYRLREEGATVRIVGPAAGTTYTSKHGYPATADADARAVSATDFDAIIIPGGYAPDHMRRSPAMVALVCNAYAQGKIVAAICHAPWMLISAGIVKGKRGTGFFSIKDDLVAAGMNYVDEEVVVDGNLITSRRPDDLPAFLRAIVAAIEHVPAAPQVSATAVKKGVPA
ncbi:MAG: type 1 glutamine amidotransferase [Anaerolineae bacterium]|nr:type 1 glutamine amidotransferase [Anaerolineae bacterium]